MGERLIGTDEADGDDEGSLLARTLSIQLGA